MGMDHGADVRPRRVDREVDRQVRRRAAAAARTRVAVRVVQPDDDEVVGVELVLAPTGRRDEHAVAHRGGRTGCLRRPRSGRAHPAGGRPRSGRRPRRAGVHRGHRTVAAGPRRTRASRRPPSRRHAVPSGDVPRAARAAARPEPRLQGPPGSPGHLRARRRRQLHRAAAARPRPDRFGPRDGHRRRPPDPARPRVRDGRRRHGRPERPQADDVPGRPRAGGAHGADPDLGRPRRTDDGRHPDRRRADEHPAVVLPGRLHGVGAGARRPVARSAARTPSSRRSTRSATSWGRPSRASSPRPSAPGRRSPSTPSRSPSPASACSFVRRDLRAPIDRPREPSSPTSARASTSSSATRRCARSILFWGVVSITIAPLVTALAVHDHPRPRLSSTRSSACSSRPTAPGPSSGALLTARTIGRGRAGAVAARRQPGHGPRCSSSSRSSRVPLLLAVAVVAGVAQSTVLVTYMTLRTAHSPDALLGRIGSTARTISLGLQPIGLLVGGALIDLTSGAADDRRDGLSARRRRRASSRRSASCGDAARPAARP